MTTTEPRLTLDCLTCRHRFTIRRSGYNLVQLCPRCRHFVIPSEREVRPPKPPKVIGPPPDDDEPFELLDPPAIVVAPPKWSQPVIPPPGLCVPPPVAVRTIDIAPSRPAQVNPAEVFARFIVGVVLGFLTVSGMILLLPVLVVGAAAVLGAFGLLAVLAVGAGMLGGRP